MRGSVRGRIPVSQRQGLRGLGIALTGVLVGGLLPIGQAMAEMFKWVDDKGNTQYSQHPPRGVKAQTLREEAPPPGVEEAVKALESHKKKEVKAEKGAEKEMVEKKKKAEDKKISEENCNLAKDQMSRLEGVGAIRSRSETDGSILTPEEIETRRKKAQADIAKDCK